MVVEKEALLREVNGTLFAPNHFKQYRQVASNSGIVPIATLEELFPQYSSEILAERGQHQFDLTFEKLDDNTLSSAVLREREPLLFNS